MSAQRDPPRWLSDAPADLREAFVQGATEFQARAPHRSQRDRMWTQLESELKVSAVAQGSWMIWAGVATAVIIGIGAVMLARPAPAPATRSIAAQPPSAAAAVEHSVAATPAAVVAPAEPRTEAAQAPALPPQVQPVARKRIAAGASSRVQSAAVSPALATNELELLVRARRLVRTAPARALELAEEHRRTFPGGTFAEERELLAIESLRGLGRHELAARRASAFRAAFPTSAHLHRIESLSGPE